MVVWSSGAEDYYKKACKIFNSRQSKINFTVEMQQDYNQYLGAKTASNDLPDLYLLQPYSQVQQFAKNGHSLDLSDRSFCGKIYSSAKKACEYNGKIYAYPMCQEMLGIFYNEDIFKKAGITQVPKTVSEFKSVCEKLKANNTTPLASIYKDSWTLNHAFSCLQGAILGDKMDSWVSSMAGGNGSFKVSNSDLAFSFMDILKNNSGKNILDADSTAGFNAFANGEAAMIFSGEFSLLNLPSINPKAKVGLFAVPVTNNAADAKLDVDVGICIAVNKNGKHINEALQVLDYLSDNTDKDGWIATTTEPVGSAQPCMKFDSGKQVPDYLKNYQEYVDGNNTIPWVYQQLASGASDLIGKTVQRYFAGTSNKDAVLSSLDKQYKDLLAQ